MLYNLQGNTAPPDFLTESELISLMEKHGIGTDASIPVHINNIGERNYVQVGKPKGCMLFFMITMLVNSRESIFCFLLFGVYAFLQVQSGRKLVPTALGITLIRGYQCIDPDLCLPDIRSFIEQQITLVAKGQADHSHVVQHVIQQFRRKFSYFVQQVGKTWLMLCCL